MWNMTILTTDPTVASVFTAANSFANNSLFGFLSLALFFILLMSLKKWEFSSALLTAGWVSFVLSAILAYGGWLNIIFPLGYLAIAGFATLYVVTVE
ncbi:MAG: hypothetical protein DRR04_05375 [Gammaproteobacteria bacterium]|nr:MAG: hypothetical protein DRQ97_06830 [Gammaproteobacteria bacterium]RLA60559.1 MAG: hypothetical protein DRR04_05375 [Gammaproteobacteria bacterium]